MKSNIVITDSMDSCIPMLNTENQVSLTATPMLVEHVRLLIANKEIDGNFVVNWITDNHDEVVAYLFGGDATAIYNDGGEEYLKAFLEGLNTNGRSFIRVNAIDHSAAVPSQLFQELQNAIIGLGSPTMVILVGRYSHLDSEGVPFVFLIKRA